MSNSVNRSGEGQPQRVQTFDPRWTHAVFENPQNGYCEAVPTLAWLWMLLFGFFYMILRGLWAHAIIIAALTLLAIQIPILGVPAVVLAWIVSATTADEALCTNYLRRGWLEVNLQPNDKE